MITLTESAKKRLGQRASAYIEDAATQWPKNRDALCPVHKASDAVRRTIGRVYGSPATIDRGETEYWEIPASDFAPEET